jgi:hypothetical protein
VTFTEDQTLAIARRVLNEPGASEERKAWADDAVKALEHGDLEAAKRIGMAGPAAMKFKPELLEGTNK